MINYPEMFLQVYEEVVVLHRRDGVTSSLLLSRFLFADPFKLKLEMLLCTFSAGSRG